MDAETSSAPDVAASETISEPLFLPLIGKESDLTGRALTYLPLVYKDSRGGPVLRLGTGLAPAVSSEGYPRLALQQSYRSMVVVAAVAADPALGLLLVRVRRAAGDSFQVKLQRPLTTTPALTETTPLTGPLPVTGTPPLPATSAPTGPTGGTTTGPVTAPVHYLVVEAGRSSLIAAFLMPLSGLIIGVARGIQYRYSVW